MSAPYDYARATISYDRHTKDAMMDAKMPTVLAQEHRTWMARIATTKVHAETARFREQRALRKHVLAGNGIGPARLGSGNGAYGHGASARTGGTWCGNQARSTDPRCGLDFGLFPTRHRANKPSDAMRRCEIALGRKPVGWLECATHMTKQDKARAAERQHAAEELAAEIRAAAQQKETEEAAQRAEKAEAEAREQAELRAQEEELAQLRKDVVAWR